MLFKPESITSFESTMSPVITKSSGVLVRPHSKPPSGNLPLSPIDKLPDLGHVVDVVQVFVFGHQPAKLIREALGQVLDHYYPLAGRLVEVESIEGGGDLEVACTGEGAWFIEASADCSLEDVNFLDRPLLISDQDILPYPCARIDAIVMIQVTEFACGGFAVGCRVNHVLFDGIGHGHFFKALGEIARGLEQPTVPPFWSRESIPGPARHPKQIPLRLENYGATFEYCTLDVSVDTINKLKKQFMVKSGGCSCTSFEVLAAKQWQCWTQVVRHDPNLLVECWFPVDLRSMLHRNGTLPRGDGGFYGNCIHAAKAEALSGKLVGASIVEVVDLMRQAKERVTGEFWSWARGDNEADPRQHSMKTEYNMLVLVDWRWMGYQEVDYGWGVPNRWGPFTTNQHFPISLIINPISGTKGARLWTRAFNKENLPAFIHLMTTPGVWGPST